MGPAVETTLKFFVELSFVEFTFEGMLGIFGMGNSWNRNCCFHTRKCDATYDCKNSLSNLIRSLSDYFAVLIALSGCNKFTLLFKLADFSHLRSFTDLSLQNYHYIYPHEKLVKILPSRTSLILFFFNNSSMSALDLANLRFSKVLHCFPTSLNRSTCTWL